jgi:hypothetical protein
MGDVECRELKMDFITDLLEQSKVNKELIAIWNYSSDDDFFCGYVLDFDEEVLSLKHFTRFGKLDGIIIQKISEIKSIDFNNDYCAAMQCVIDYSEQLEKEVYSEKEVVLGDNWIIETLGNYLGKRDAIISIEINNREFYTGFLKKLSETDLLLNNIGKMGENEGDGVYKLGDISSLRVEDIDNRKRLLLYNWRQSIKF